MQRSMILFACVRPKEGLRGQGLVLLAAPPLHHGSSPPARLQEERIPEVLRAPLRGTHGAQRPPTMSVDQAFRALARVDPPVLLALVHAIAPQVLPADATLTADAVDDPHLDAPPPPLEARLDRAGRPRGSGPYRGPGIPGRRLSRSAVPVSSDAGAPLSRAARTHHCDLVHRASRTTADGGASVRRCHGACNEHRAAAPAGRVSASEPANSLLRGGRGSRRVDGGGSVRAGGVRAL